MVTFVMTPFPKKLKKQIKMIEIKISQGAKPGHGGMLLAPKVTKEIAETRGIEVGKIASHPQNTKNFQIPLSFLTLLKNSENSQVVNQ